ncbi:hypothetical protein ACFQ1I_45125 [Kitasatospora arboriphila]
MDRRTRVGVPAVLLVEAVGQEGVGECAAARTAAVTKAVSASSSALTPCRRAAAVCTSRQ